MPSGMHARRCGDQSRALATTGGGANSSKAGGLTCVGRTRSIRNQVESLVHAVEHAALRHRITFFDELGRESQVAVVRQTTLVNYANGGVDRCKAEL